MKFENKILIKTLLILFLYSFTEAQNNISQNIIPVDTSFTVHSAYEKVIKDFPFAKIVTPDLKADINQFYNIIYADYGNRKLHLDLFVPKKNDKLFPAVILVHGGGWHSGNKLHQVPMAIDLAKNGFVTAAVEYRFSAEAIYPAAVKDLKASIKWLKANAEKYKIDTTKIAILGCSAGAQLASLVGFSNGEKKYEPEIIYENISSDVHAVINIDGLLDFTSGESKEFDTDPNKPRSAHLWFGASFEKNPDLWKEGSAFYHVDENDVPIIFINSILPHYHAGRDAMIEKLKKYKIYYEVHTIENTPHPFWLFHPWFEETFDYVLNFLNKVFKTE